VMPRQPQHMVPVRNRAQRKTEQNA
jgi:hypothetical protein